MPIIRLSVTDIRRVLSVSCYCDGTRHKGCLALQKKLTAAIAPLTEGFDTYEEEASFVKRQLEFYKQLRCTAESDAVGWIALKLTISRAIARRLIARVER